MEKQKKYFKINLGLFMLGVLLIYVLGQVYRYKIDEYNKFLRVPKDLKIVNLGSSHGQYGFIYSKEENGYNLGVSSQPFFYDEAILKKYKNHLKEEGVVLIPISIFSFYRGYEIKENSEMYYSFLDYSEIYEGDKRQIELKKRFPLLYNGKLLLPTLKYFTLDILKGNFEPKSVIYPRNLSLEEKIEEADKTSKRHMGLDDENFSQTPKIGLSQLKNIIEICRENKFIPILVTTPQTYLYNERVTKEGYKERIHLNIEKVKKEIETEVLYLDYSHDSRFENSLEYFYDDDHLNELGAEKFTKIVIEDLKERGLLK